MTDYFIKLIRSDETEWLSINKPMAFALLGIIAQRARRYDGAPDGLTIGQCHLGDWKDSGFSRQNYRTALEILKKRKHIASILTNRKRKKSTTGLTTEGTLVQLLSSNVYDININVDNHSPNHCPTTAQPQTKKKKNIKEKDIPPSASSAAAAELAPLLADAIKKTKADAKIPTSFKTWEKELEALIRIDERSFDDVKKAIKSLPSLTFWSQVCLSASSLRKNWDKISLACNQNDKPKKFNYKQAVKEYFKSGSFYNGAECFFSFDPDAINLQRGMPNVVSFMDTNFEEKFKQLLARLGIKWTPNQ